jgi:CHASE1-domain containing sensor protein
VKSSILQIVSCVALLALLALMGLVAKGTIQKLGATFAVEAVRNASLLRDRVLKSISYAGNNGRPGGA